VPKKHGLQNSLIAKMLSKRQKSVFALTVKRGRQFKGPQE
jgi:hypothetical protein